MLAALTRATALRHEPRAETTVDARMGQHASAERESRAARAGRGAATGRLDRGLRNRDQFLAQLEGLYVDDDPAQGIIEGRSFTHPDLRMQFVVPPGYQMQNGTRAVTITGSAGQAQFSGGRYTGSLENYIDLVLQEIAGGQVQDGGPAAAAHDDQRDSGRLYDCAGQHSSGAVDVSVMAYQWDANTAYHFVMLTQGRGGDWSVRVDGRFRCAGFRPPKPLRSARESSMWWRSAATTRCNRWRAAWPIATFSSNGSCRSTGWPRTARLVPGQKVKLVVYGARRA